MLSYDWIKITLSVVAAVVALVVFFTMVTTRPSDAQSFEVYLYYGISGGQDFGDLPTDLKDEHVFSYEVLETPTETFSEGDSYSSAVFTARRSTLQGEVMFVNDVKREAEKEEERLSRLDELNRMGIVLDRDSGKMVQGLLHDPQAFLEQDVPAYLKRFFGEDFETGTLNEAEVEACFTARNSGDNRFRSASKRAAGIESEKARINKLRTDYLNVRAAFEAGKLGYTRSVVTLDGQTYDFCVGVNVGKLNTIGNLCYYTVGEDKTKLTQALNVVLFNNGEKNGFSDLKFETVSFLSYLVRHYGV